jgi:hypothetical protein
VKNLARPGEIKERSSIVIHDENIERIVFIQTARLTAGLRKGRRSIAKQRPAPNGGGESGDASEFKSVAT